MTGLLAEGVSAAVANTPADTSAEEPTIDVMDVMMKMMIDQWRTEILLSGGDVLKEKELEW